MALLVITAVAAAAHPVRVDQLPVSHADYLVPVNSADAPTLALLPGVGPALAQRIIDERQAHGRFTSLEDLRRVRGVGDVLLSRMAPLIEFDVAQTRPR